MKKILSRIRLISILLFVLFPLLFSCDQSPPESIFPENAPCRYEVRGRLDGFEIIGTLFFDEDGSIRFLHQKENTPLFGMEEAFRDGRLFVSYRGLSWDSDEADTSFYKLFCVLDDFRRQSEAPLPAEKIDGKELCAKKIPFRDGEVTLFFNKKGLTPYKMIAGARELELELFFFDPAS
ncbi:MAG: hypothetical protein IKD31_06365 [Clostridia bacterium]|nr:hypothetical protein [Clostridia bacterium]